MQDPLQLECEYLNVNILPLNTRFPTVEKGIRY